MASPTRVASSDDATVRTRFVGVSGEGFDGGEVEITLDGKAQRAAQVTQFAHANVTEFGIAHAEVAETEGNVVETEFG